MIKQYTLIFLLFLFSGCATYKAKYDNTENAEDVTSTKEISHTFYLIGDAGKSPMGDMNPALKLFQNALTKADKNSTAIFLGDNIYPAGFPDKKDFETTYLQAKNHLDAQLNTLTDFKGKTIFIPGNHDWYKFGLKGLERQQKYIQKKLDKKNVFLPENGCPIEEVKISDDIILIAIDTEWYLTNWDKHPTMNDKCEIKDREKFFEELESLIKKNNNKTTIIAMHHPMFSYGSHGGQFSVRQHLFPNNGSIPMPILGTLINILRKTSGASIEDMQNSKYTALRKRLVTLAQYSNKVIFTSGHEHTLQYIVEENTPQIVSGSGAKKGATRLMNGSKFSTGQMGYAMLEVYTDGSSRIRFYGLDTNEKEKFLFTSEVLSPNRNVVVEEFEDTFPAVVKASVYNEDEVIKSGLYKTILGERYRAYYGTKVAVPTVRLDTLFGGLTPVRKGGGHQSKSLRLQHSSGKQYVMRALRKSAELYLQSMAFKEQYIVGEFENTFTEKILSDFYTGTHPYAPFTIGVLSDAVDVYHTNPQLFYVPKQKALQDFNEAFGDELYMIEEHVSDGHGNLASFGFSDNIISTDDLIKNLRRDEKYKVDKEAYIRARLFDMMIGDWDRHVDQWRWAAFENKEGGFITYKPIPRDRDQAFSMMGDGALMSVATRIIPGLRLMEGFTEEIRSVEGFNSSPKTYILDMALLPETPIALWEEQAQFIQNNITPEIIDRAFTSFPKEVHDETVVRIKKVLLARKDRLLSTARSYYEIINKYGIIVGTDKDDYFSVNRLPNNKTTVVGQRIKDGEKEAIFFKKTFDKETTKEIWIYGLDDDDIFDIQGENNITLRVIGGQNNDTYKSSSGKKVHVYDFKSKKNTYTEAIGAKLHRTNDYDTNNYLFSRLKSNTNQFIPTIGANPDDGFKIGLSNIYTYNGFRQNPFTQQHTINASFYFATKGFDIMYKGEYANIAENLNFEIETKFTSPNYSINFFGFGNETVNLDDELELDYNRVKIESIYVLPSIVWRSNLGAKFALGLSYEDIEVEETEDRFINTFYQANGEDTGNRFVGFKGIYTYENRDSEAFPTLGMATNLQFGYKKSTINSEQGFGFVIPSLSINYKLVPNGRLVLATKWKAHFNLGDDYEFYQAASIGASDGLRGFRNQRFTGKTAYYQNTDIRYSIKKLKTGLLPTSIGFYGGFDYGRVWLPNEDSDTWHHSYGGGVFFNGSDIISATVSLFQSDDGPRFAFGFGFGF